MHHIVSAAYKNSLISLRKPWLRQLLWLRGLHDTSWIYRWVIWTVCCKLLWPSITLCFTATHQMLCQPLHGLNKEHFCNCWVAFLQSTLLPGAQATVANAMHWHNILLTLVCWLRMRETAKRNTNRYHVSYSCVQKQYYSNLVSSSSDNPRRIWLNNLLHRKSSLPLPSFTSASAVADRLASLFGDKISKSQQFYLSISSFTFSENTPWLLHF